MQLLIAVDSVTTTEIILKVVESRLWPPGTEARIVSIVEDPEVASEVWRETGYGVGAVQREMARRGEQIAALAVDRLQRVGIATNVVVTRGNPEVLIPLGARKWGADLILIRANNRRDFRNRLLGSVARSVTADAPCSVELVREIPDVSRDGLRILFAADESEGSGAAARHIAQTSWPGDTKINVVSAVNPFIYSLEDIGLFTDKGTRRALQAISAAVKQLSGTGLEISADVVAGRADKEILKHARLWEADLIVVGSNQRHGLKGMMVRSISEAIARRAPCSVRVVRSDSHSLNDVKWPSKPSRVYEVQTKVALKKAA